MPSEFSIAGFTLHIYGALVGVATVVVLKVAEYHLGHSDHRRAVFWDTTVVLLVCTLIGSRLWHVATDWHLYNGDLLSVLYVWRGGLSIVGGVAGMLVGAYLATRYFYKKLQFFEVTDVVVIGLPFGQALGRIGNWFNQELYGLPTSLPWKIYIDPAHRLAEYHQFAYYHPLFLYEAVALLIFGGVLWWLATRNKVFEVGSGLVTLLYLALYGWLRFFLEFLRIDKATIAASSVGVNQVVMLVVAVSATVLLVRKYSKVSK